MSYTVIAVYVVLQALYLAAAVGQIVLVASKFYEHALGQWEFHSIATFANAIDSIQDKFAAFSGSALLICCILTALRSLFFIMGYTRVIPCALMSYFGAAIFQFFKTLMYSIFIFRAEAIYRDTPYAYSTRRMKGTATMLVLYNVVVYALFFKFVSNYEKEDAGALCLCTANVPMVVLLPSIAQDIFMNLLFLRLFTKPLRLLTERTLRTESSAPLPLECKPANGTLRPKLSSDQVSDTGTGAVVRVSTTSSSVEQRSRDDLSDLRRVAVKCAVVTWVAVASTFINLLIVGSLGHLEFIVLDYLINNTCMIFMTHWCDQYFPKLCCVPLAVARIMTCLCGDIPEF